MSDAQLDTLRKIPCKFQLNPSSRLGGVVRTRFFDFDDLRTDDKQALKFSEDPRSGLLTHTQTHTQKQREREKLTSRA